MEKRRNCSSSFPQYFYMLDFHFKAGIRFSFRDKRLFEISEVEVARVNCIVKFLSCVHDALFFHRTNISVE